MFATIRRYTPKGTVPGNGMEEVGRLIRDGFAPLVREIPGFHSYYCVNVRDRELVTVSVFETSEGGAESTRRASKFVRESKLPFELNPPEVLEGEVIASAESQLGVR